MKTYGYPVGEPLNPYGLLKLKEVTFSASPETLRAIAGFLLQAAQEMEREGAHFDHLHIQDELSSWPEHSADIVVCRPSQA
jgi:hypothetical protein